MRTRSARAGRRGSILIEALAGIVLTLLATCLNLEIVRRAWYEVTFHHGAFLAARARALGAGSDRARGDVRHFLLSAFGEEKGASLGRGLRLAHEVDDRGLVARAHYRFPTFLRFPYAKGTKHHFEVTRRCRFPF